MINSKTSFLALIGNPVEHSLSPIIQNAALRYMKLNLVYLAIPCNEKDFDLVVDSLKKINCRGLNITIPFKEKAFKLCTEISPVAEKIRAINTLKLNKYDEWSGTNTDVAGFIHPLTNLSLNNKKSIVLGSGGAARSVIQGLIDLDLEEIIIISRNKKTLHNLINDFKNQKNIKGLLNNDLQVSDSIANTDLIVNTTPVGMKKTIKENELFPFGKNFWKSINSNTIVYDLIYNPNPTALLKYCKKKGCHTIDGTEMLIAQGVKSLSYWTNELEIPFEVMKKALINHL